MDFPDIKIPEIIFDKDSNDGVYKLEEFPCIPRAVQWQVKDIICKLIIFPDLISWRRKESKEYFMAGFIFNGFNQGTSLFKFTQRRAMEPDYFFTRRNGRFYFIKNSPSATDPQFCLWMKGGNQQNCKVPELQWSIVKKYCNPGKNSL